MLVIGLDFSSLATAVLHELFPNLFFALLQIQSKRGRLSLDKDFFHDVTCEDLTHTSLGLAVNICSAF